MGALLTSWLICTGCHGSGPVEQAQSVPVSVAAATATPAVVASVAAAPATAPVAVPSSAPAKVAAKAASAMSVKRLVVATGVRDREPLAASDALPADGTPIYAFAELSNVDGESENVRITFERQGGKQRAGDVVLPVPGKATRHRTWAFTRNIFAAGRWDAVVWSESGAELGRTSFDVKAS